MRKGKVYLVDNDHRQEFVKLIESKNYTAIKNLITTKKVIPLPGDTKADHNCKNVFCSKIKDL